MPPLIEINNRTRSDIDEPILKEAAAQILALCKKKSASLSIAFIGESSMSRLNRVWMGKRGATDVLSFRGSGRELGEVIICQSAVKRQAQKHKISPESELVFILIHGILHLTGMQDENEEQRREMIRKGLNILRKLRIPQNYKSIHYYGQDKPA